MPVIMGRKTFESFGKPLAGRTNIMVTTQEGLKIDGVIVTRNLNEALIAAYATDAKEVFIIGGGEIFRQALSMTGKIYLTRVHVQLEGEAFFPELSEAEWNLVSNLYFSKDEKHLYDYSFQVWERRINRKSR
jgi:dihydrofolate reductase